MQALRRDGEARGRRQRRREEAGAASDPPAGCARDDGEAPLRGRRWGAAEEGVTGSWRQLHQVASKKSVEELFQQSVPAASVLKPRLKYGKCASTIK